MKNSMYFLFTTLFLVFTLSANALPNCNSSNNADTPEWSRGIPELWQSDTLPSLKPENGEWGFGIRAEGLQGLIWNNNFDSLSLQLRYALRPSAVFRVDAGIALYKEKTSLKDVFSNGGHQYNEDAETLSSFSISPAMEWHFNGTRRLDPYLGLALPLVFVGKRHITEIDETINSNGTFFKREILRELLGGLGFGINGIAGINYFVSNRLALGLEYSIGASLVNVSGKIKMKTTTRSKPSPTGSETITITESGDDEISQRDIFFGNKGVAGINLIFYLGR